MKKKEKKKRKKKNTRIYHSSSINTKIHDLLISMKVAREASMKRVQGRRAPLITATAGLVTYYVGGSEIRKLRGSNHSLRRVHIKQRRRSPWREAEQNARA